MVMSPVIDVGHRVDARQRDVGGGPTSAGLRRRIVPGVPRLPSAWLRFAVSETPGLSAIAPVKSDVPGRL